MIASEWPSRQLLEWVGSWSPLAGLKTPLLVELLRIYLEQNLLLLVCAIGLWTLWAYERRRGVGQSSRVQLTLARLCLVAALLLPPLTRILPDAALPPPQVQVWSGAPEAASTRTGAILTRIAQVEGEPGFELGVSRRGMNVLSLSVLSLIAGLVVWRSLQVRQLRRRLQALPVLHQVGAVRVVVSDGDLIPFAAWLGPELAGSRPLRSPAWVVMPSSLLLDPARLTLALKHELQHHRQGDTRWAMLELFLNTLFFWNPAMGAWSRLSLQLQEFACDATLLGQNRVTFEAYGRCLLETAQLALSRRASPIGTTGMAAGLDGAMLTRRLTMMKRSSVHVSRPVRLLWTLVALLILTSSALASRSVVQDRTLNQTELVELLKTPPTGVAPGKDLPLLVNPTVMERLNRLVGTPEGRTFLRNGLARMPELKPGIATKLQAAGLPDFLLAVPLLESGYKNLPDVSKEPSGAPGPRGAGIWMFIVPTAKNYGLTINEKVDERLDIDKETDAAIRLFQSLYKEFGDWNLALAGYNQGEKWVHGVIEQEKTRDAWTLVEREKLNDYLPSMMAVRIVMAYPKLLE